MNQNTKTYNSLCLSSPSNAQALLTSLCIKDYPATRLKIKIGGNFPTEYDVLDIRVIGVGPLGTRMVKLLSRNLAGINCHEIIHDVEEESSGSMATLISSVRSSDLVFILSEFEDEFSVLVAQTVGSASCEVGVLTLLATPCTGIDLTPHQCNGQHGKWYDTIFHLPENSLSNRE